MAQISKNCLTCNSKFRGRRDAKTCSVTCRKRLQRAKAAILTEAGVLKGEAGKVIDTLAGEILPAKLATASATADPSVETDEDAGRGLDDSQWQPSYLDLPSTPDFIYSAQNANATGLGPVAGGTGPIASGPVTNGAKLNPANAASAARPGPAAERPLITPVPPEPAGAVYEQPKILSLESSSVKPRRVPEAFIPASISPQASAVTMTPVAATGPQTSLANSLPSTTIPPDQKTNQVQRIAGLFKNRRFLPALGVLTMVLLVAGIFALSKLVKQSTPIGTVASTQNDEFFTADENGVLNLNLDTLIKKDKSLTVGQIIASPDTQLLQVTGDVQSTGTLLASDGQSSLNNNGLKINNVVVCNATGCKTGATTTLASTLTGQVNLINLPIEVTLQGNTFNSASQLVQLTSAGLLPVLSAANLTNLNASNISSGSLADARLSSNVAILNGSQTYSGSPLFKNASDSTTAFRIQNAAGTNLVLINTTASTVTIVGLQGSGANLTDLNASNLTSGTVPAARLPGTVSLLGDSIESAEITDGTIVNADVGAAAAIAYAKLNLASSIVTGDITDGTIVNADVGAAAAIAYSKLNLASSITTGDITDLTIVNADISATAAIVDTKLATISTAGKVADTALSANVALLNGTGPQTFSGNNAFTGTFLAQNAADSTTAFRVQNAAGNNFILANTTAGSLNLCDSAACDTLSLATNVDADAINIGDALDTVTITGAAASTIVLNGTTISAAELNLLDGHDVALVDTNDAVATAIVGTGALDAGSITINFGAINTGADNITTTGTVQGTTSVLTSALDVTAAGTLTIGGTTATAVNLGNATGTTAVSVLCGTGTCGFGNNATDHSTIIGSTTVVSATTVNAGTGGLSLGNNGVANTIQIGTTTGAVAQTIAIGNNATALSTNTVTIGNLLSTSATTIQGGTGASAIGLQAGTSGTISIGTTNVNTVTIGSTANTGTLTFGQATTGETIAIGNGQVADTKTNTINIGTSATATGKNDITIGSANAASSLILQGGTGTVTLQSQSAIGVGNNLVAQTITIGNATGTTAVSVLCGSGTCGFGNNATDHSTTIGSTTVAGATTVQGGTSGVTIISNGTTISATELALLDGHDVALVDTNDAVATAIIGTGALDAGSITANFGSINVGADNITTTGTVQGTTSVLTSLLDTTAAGALAIGTTNATSISLNQNTSVSGANTFSTGTGAVSLNGATTVAANKAFNAYGTALFKSATNATDTFQIQNAAGINLTQVDTTTDSANLITNGSLEIDTTGWTARGSSTVTRSTSGQYLGGASLSIATTAAANDGAKYAYALASSTQYTFTLYSALNSGTFTTMQMGRADDGTTDTSCLDAQTVTTTAWTRFTCTFTTGTTSGSPYVYVKQTDATSRTFFIDAVKLEVAASATPYREGIIYLNGNVSSPLTIKNQTNSTAAFQIQNVAGTSNLFVADTANTRIGIGTATPAATLDVDTGVASGQGVRVVANSITSGDAFLVTSNSTAGSGTSINIRSTRSGANANASHTAYGVYSTVTNTGTTSTNVGGYFSASGATNNYAGIFENGSVGIGTTDASGGKLVIKQSVNSPGGTLRTIRSDTTGYADWFAGADGNAYIQLNGSGYCGTTGGGANWACSSDERKKDIQGNFTRGLVDLQGIDPILFTLKSPDGSSGIQAGFSAQNVMAAIPEAVNTGPDGYLILADRPILAAVVNAIQELNNKLESIQGGNEELTSLVVHSNTTTDTLTVSGDAEFKGTVTIAGDTEVQGTLTLADHLITTGIAPTATAETSAGAGATCDVSGNDTSGTITITSGTDPTAGELAKMTFHKTYGKPPKVILTPANGPATDLKYFYNSTTSDFSLHTAAAPTASTTYTFSYLVIQ